MSLSVIVNIFLFFLVSGAYSNINKKPIVLQWQVSHSRNTDQISLIFRQDSVELITNTSNYQKGRTIRLGWFKTDMNPELKLIREQIKGHYNQLKNTVPISSVIVKDLRIQTRVDPHAPVLHINGQKIHNRHPFFDQATKIVREAWKIKWICIECAMYEKKKKNIIRTTKKLQVKSQNKKREKGKIQWDETKQTLVKKILNCIPKGKKKEECIDPQFGVFEI